MKQFLLLFSIFIAVGLHAQNTKPKYHAIDGSEWINKYDRDQKEILLHNTLSLDLHTALASGRLGSDQTKAKAHHDALKKLFDQCLESFVKIREADEGKELLHNAEFRFFLSENGISAKPGQTRNRESFNMEEHALCFDEVLKEYSFNSQIVKELADPNGKTYNIDFVVNDFTERMKIVSNKMERELLSTEFKGDSIVRMIPRYEAAKKRAEELQKQKRPKRRQR